MQTSDLIRNLFHSFHKQNIVYCHWKSNEHLEASFKGDTDFDILFNREQKAEIEKIFAENGFVLFTAPYNRRYNEIDDFIAIDYEQNRIIHFHTHYNLEIGTSGLKEYRYAIEDKIFDSRIYDPIYDCYLIDPRYEFLLLVLRLSLKVTESWKSNFSKNKEIGNSTVELEWLKKRVSIEQLLELIEELKIPYNKETVLSIYNEGFSYNSLHLLSLRKNKINNLHKDSLSSILTKKWTKKLYFQYGRVLRKTGLSYVVKQRVKEDGGFTIAVLGCDGSGKSTQMSELKRIFSTKMDVDSFYLGSNKGSRSNTRRVLEYIRDKNLVSKVKVLEQLLSLSLALSIGVEKQARLSKGRYLKKKGLIVLFDRFPQNENYSFNDGPLLTKTRNSSNPLFKKIGEFEKKLYSPQIDKYPDIIFKLVVDPLVISQRRNMSLEHVNIKQNSILNMTFENKAPIVEINANMNIKEVTSEILKMIQKGWLDKK